MTTFQAAVFREQGIDLILVILNQKFGAQSPAEQRDFTQWLQIQATQAKIAGTVVPVWREGNNFRFLAPPKWHPFFKSITWEDLLLNVNTELHVPD